MGKSHDNLPTSTERPPSPAELRERFKRDIRFNPPPPPIWKRVALLLLIATLFYFALKMRFSKQEAEIIYADRAQILEGA